MSMTFDTLRALIAAEMPPGWGFSLWHRQFSSTLPVQNKSSDEWWYVQCNTLTPPQRGPSNYKWAKADTPEALLAAWRELKGKLA